MTTEISDHEKAALEIIAKRLGGQNLIRAMKNVEKGMSDSTYYRRFREATSLLEEKGLITSVGDGEWSLTSGALSHFREHELLGIIAHLQSALFDAQRTQMQQKPLVGVYESMHLHRIVVEETHALFRDGHYAEAIFEAYKRINNEVKAVSSARGNDGRELDGEDLMAHAFREQNPAIRLNALLSRSDRDEQKGFMYLFMGAMKGIRNPKAHDSIVQNDPYRTLEYLSLASLLLQRLDERVR
jgi:uncharacterized protein (TIGR02391 family)